MRDWRSQQTEPPAWTSGHITNPFQKLTVGSWFISSQMSCMWTEVCRHIFLCVSSGISVSVKAILLSNRMVYVTQRYSSCLACSVSGVHEGNKHHYLAFTRLYSTAKYARTEFSPFLSSSLASYPLPFKGFIPETCLELRALHCKVFLLIPSLEFVPFGGDGALLIASAVLDCYRALEQNRVAWVFALCKITLWPYGMEG